MTATVRTSPTVGVVIVNYQSWQPLRACLDGLLAEPADRIKVTVVDNDSPDDRMAEFAAAFPQVTFLRNPGNPGFAHACNVGARHIGGDVLLFLNPDTVMSPHAILELAQELCAQDNFGIISPQIEDAAGCRQNTGEVFPGPLTQLPLGRRVARRFAQRTWKNASTDTIRACDYVPGCALMIRRTTFEAMGGWAEEFWMYCEDIDLCWRVRESGLLTGWSGRHVAQHLQGQSSGSSEDSAVRCRVEHVRARHVLYSRHLHGARAVASHVMEAAKRLLRLFPAALFDIATGGSNRKYCIRRRALSSLLGYYRNTWREGAAAAIGDWRSH